MFRYYFKKTIFISAICFIAACNNSGSIHTTNQKVIHSNLTLTKDSFKIKDSCDLEKLFVAKHLVNINSLDSNIRVVIHYSTSQNFLNKPIYKGLNNCYLPCEVAIKLCNAEYYLNSNFPNYHIIVFDAVRPLHIQKQMWEELEMPVEEKINYLAHPSDLSLHNYGAAVDVGIIGTNDVLLDMGTSFDFFGELSEPKREKEFVENGQLSKEAHTNRLLLRDVMTKAGFTPITSEWWHFNATNKAIAAVKFELID
ncbi:MAG: M15 family metallopeptidase [Bacteroidia bacterium]